MSRRRWGTTALIAALAVGGLTGCTGSDDKPPSQAQTDPGQALETMDADGLPADFPRDKVPLLTGGEVTSVERDGTSGYAVTMLVDPEPADAVAQAVSLLEDAGWTSATDDPGDPVQVLRNGDGLVIITNSVSNGQTVVNYAVTLT